MQNTMNQFNTLAAELNQNAKNFENQICSLIDAEKSKGNTLFRKSQECKDLTAKLSDLHADAESKLNTVRQGKAFYESDMKNLLYYYAIKSLYDNQLLGERTFKRNLDKLEKTLLEYINQDPNFEKDENFKISIYKGEYYVSIYLTVNESLKLTTDIHTTHSWDEPKKTYFNEHLRVPDEKPEITTADEYINMANTIKKHRKEYFEKLKKFREENNHLLTTFGKYCEFTDAESEIFKVKRY